MRQISFFLFACFLLSFACQTSAQPFFQRYDSIPVTLSTTPITNAWAGGLNFIQSSSIDLNMDGLPDLFMFDRTGNKIRTFINKGTVGAVNYHYDASYESKFPKMHDWVLLADYNGDGKEDIFCYSDLPGGYDVYKNTSTVATGLSFQLVMTQQKSIFNPSKFNNAPASIPDNGVISTWDGTFGSGTYASRPINVTGLNTSYWKLTEVTLNVTHPNDADLIVYLVSPSGNKIRLIKNAGGSGDNFANTTFATYATNVIGSAGFNTAPFKATYIPEAGAAALSAFIAGCTSPNGVWYLNVGDQAAGNTGTVKNWALTFYSPTYPPTVGFSMVNLYVSPADVPAIVDIDNDGDLDVVTFAITGTYMEYHQNLSQELYGNSDSLIYQMKNRSWGYASEDPLSNNYTLHDTAASNVASPGIVEDHNDTRSVERHSGSCELCIDLDNDGDKEFIVGDISFNNLTMLTNNGTPLEANMTAIDVAFPSNTASTIAVDQTIFPCAYYTDVNDDGVKDLIVSPNAPNVSENFNSVAFYKNTGTNTAPIFEFQQSNLLQDNMIEVGEGAFPTFFDYDNDGLQDLFIGNYGYFGASGYTHSIAQFHNTGTATAPQFTLVTRNWMNLSSLVGVVSMVPAFGDMDGDGDADMFLGADDGVLHYYKNTAAAGAPANFVLTMPNYKNSAGRLIDVGNNAAPVIADMDGDGKNDVVIGARSGKLAYYHHSGSATAPTPVLDSITHFFGNVKVNQPGYFSGYSYPFIFKQSGVTKILCGSELGYLRLYDHIDGNLTGVFTLVDSTFENLQEGDRSTPCGTDLNNDGYLDLVVGNYQGGVSYFKGVSNLTTSNELDNSIYWNLEIYPNPANNNIHIHFVSDKSATYKIELYNVMGQLITVQHSSGEDVLLNSENISQGVYFFKVAELSADGRSTTSMLTKRVVINH